MTTFGMCTATLLADPLGEPSDAELRAAVASAVAAGCPELSVWAHHLAAMGDIAALGARVAAVEAAVVWATGDEQSAAAEARQLAHLAGEHGATVIAAVTLEPEVPDLARARDNLAVLVAAAEEVDAQVCVEFLPWSGIPSLAAAWDLVEPLGARAGILLDTWHWQRQPVGPSPRVLEGIPGERIGYVQVCDAAAQPHGDTFEEAMTGRQLPGDGVVDFAALFSMLDRIGARPFVATEIFNPSLVAEIGSMRAGEAMAVATRRVLDRG